MCHGWHVQPVGTPALTAATQEPLCGPVRTHLEFAYNCILKLASYNNDLKQLVLNKILSTPYRNSLITALELSFNCLTTVLQLLASHQQSQNVQLPPSNVVTFSMICSIVTPCTVNAWVMNLTIYICLCIDS